MLFHHPHGRFNTGAEAQLFQQVFDVDLDGGLGYVEFAADQFVAQALGDEFENLHFPAGQAVEVSA
jgi:hypothetical protein